MTNNANQLSQTAPDDRTNKKGNATKNAKEYNMHQKLSEARTTKDAKIPHEQNQTYRPKHQSDPALHPLHNKLPNQNKKKTSYKKYYQDKNTQTIRDRIQKNAIKRTKTRHKTEDKRK